MAQNIYDDERFFAGYGRLERSIAGLDGAAEWPAIRAMLPPMGGLTVLDLGCGYGWFCRFARSSGADRVVGVDLSERMLDRARVMTADPAIRYVDADLEALTLEEAAFDLVYSSLAFHYVEDIGRLLGEVRRALKPGGRLVFSVEHPIFMAPASPDWIELDGRKVWPLDRYLDEGERRTDWLAEGVIKQHRTIATYLNALLRLGFRLDGIDEWGPTAEQIAARPEWAVERDRPPFLLVALHVPDAG